MRIKLYQINPDRDTNRIAHTRLSELERFQGSPDVQSSIYDEVFNAVIDQDDLEDIFFLFNTDGHPLYRGGSMKVSDVVVTEEGAFYCDSVGFKPVTFDESQTQKPDNLLKVVYVEPGKPPYEAEILHTLEAQQKAVGGFIEPVYLEDDITLVGNEESKLIGMPGNRRLDSGSIIAGPFYLVGDAGDDFRSLTDEEAQRMMKRFEQPEDISPEEVEADTGFYFISF